jgi:hypothetical protein
VDSWKVKKRKENDSAYNSIDNCHILLEKNVSIIQMKPFSREILSPWQDAGMDPWQLFVIFGFSASSMLISIVCHCGRLWH